jgi:hypothetical protein
MDLIKNIVRSKRFWTIVIAGIAHLLVRYHVVLTDTTVSDIADQLVLVACSAGVIGTKVLDSRKASQAAAPTPPEPKPAQ